MMHTSILTAEKVALLRQQCCKNDRPDRSVEFAITENEPHKLVLCHCCSIAIVTPLLLRMIGSEHLHELG